MQLIMAISFLLFSENTYSQNCKFGKDIIVKNDFGKTIIKTSNLFFGFSISKFEVQVEKSDTAIVSYELYIDAFLKLNNFYNNVRLDSVMLTLIYDNGDRFNIINYPKVYINKASMTLSVYDHEFHDYFTIPVEQLNTMQNIGLNFWNVQFYLTNLKELTSYTYLIEYICKEKYKEKVKLMAGCILSI